MQELLTYISRNTFQEYYTGVAPITQEREAAINTNCIKQQPNVLYRRIGSTTYKVRVHFNDTGKETIGDKIVRLIENDALTNVPACAIIKAPQMSRPPEGSSQ